MINGRKVIACTPAGRRKNLEVLIPYVLRDRGIIDHYQLWLNTEDEEDIHYVRQLASDYPRFISVVERDPSIPIDDEQKSYSIYQFFKHCVEPDVVYVRLDDDIVFIDENAIENLVRFRLDNPGYFLVYGNTVNNAICSHLHQRMGLLGQQLGNAGYWFIDPLGWGNGEFAERVHRNFLYQLNNGDPGRFRCFDRWELNQYERVSINVICWSGNDFAQFGGRVEPEEEWWLSQIKPDILGRMNCICGQALFSHYAFFVQKPHLDETDVLERYKQLTPAISKP